MLGCAIFLYLVSLDTHLPVAVAAFCFFGYLFSYGIMSILPGIYPEEVFPTSVRSAGVGVATAASRAGAAVGTFALPHILNAWGLPALMIIMGTVSLIGAITSYSWAPETNGRALTETSQREDPHSYRRRRAAFGEAR
jgi:MFS transporter, putative metabolite transport protein